MVNTKRFKQFLMNFSLISIAEHKRARNGHLGVDSKADNDMKYFNWFARYDKKRDEKNHAPHKSLIQSNSSE